MPLKYDKTKKKGVLGTLFGVIADTVLPTRNKRRYTEALWDKVFSDDIVKEQIANGGIFGELGHPVDRTETDMEKIAIVMPEIPKKNPEGKLEARFDILDTPNGRIAKTLADYGYKLGISSRGNGDVVEDFESGEDFVDEDTYDFQAFDLVIVPACKDARLSLVESFNNDSKFKTAIREQLEKSDEKEKRIMNETLNSLGINCCQSSDEVDIDAVPNDKEVADDKSEIVKELQEALTKNDELTRQIATLQEKLSVGYTKEMELKDSIVKYRSVIIKLNESLNKNKGLEEQLESLSKKCDESDKKAKLFESGYRKAINRGTELRESVGKHTSEMKVLQEKLQSVSNELDATKTQYEGEIKSLNESIAELNKNLSLKEKEYSSKLTKKNRIIESCRDVATEAVRRYIDMQALRIGVTANEIKNRLSESYSFDDIDDVCHSLQEYKVNMTKLPIAFSSDKKPKVKITESKQKTILPESVKNDLQADDIDPVLVSMLLD